MSSVIAFNTAGDSIIPYFNEGLFLTNLEEYLQENLKPFVISYRYECSFERVEPYPPGEHCNMVNVDFDFTLSLVSLAHRHAEFLILESPYE